MKILKSKRKDNTYFLELEESHENIQKAMDPAFQKVAGTARIPGFRKGKVTRAVFERYYGDGPILKEAISHAINEAYFQAITELKLDVLDFPKNVTIGEYEPNKPLNFTCEVDVRPEINLGKYKGLKVTQESTEVNPEEIDAQITTILENHADFVSVDRPSQEGDIVRFHMKATIDNEPFEQWTRENAGTLIGKGHFGKAFDAHVLNVNKDVSKSFSVNYEPDFHVKEVAGKTVQFDITITDIREKKLPELTNEWTEKFLRVESVEKLKNDIKAHLEEQKNKDSQTKLRTDIANAVLDSTKIVVPDVMVERQIDNKLRFFEYQLQQSKSNLDNYLKMTGKPISDLRNELKESAAKDVMVGLALDEIAKEEKITVSDDEINAEIQKWGMEGVTDIASLTKQNPSANIESIRNSLMENKTYDFLIAAAKISK